MGGAGARQTQPRSRFSRARLGSAKPLADFDWTWPRSIDRDQIEELERLAWLADATNVVLVGQNGVGKTMIARRPSDPRRQNRPLPHRLGNAQHPRRAGILPLSLRRKLALFTAPQLLVIDELGYLSYDSRHADLLFEVVSRRYERRSILTTTNKPFAEWNEVFPSATSVVTIVDRLVHRCEIVPIDADSYRLKESKLARKPRRTQAPTPTNLIAVPVHPDLEEAIAIYSRAPDTPAKPSRRDWAVVHHLLASGITPRHSPSGHRPCFPPQKAQARRRVAARTDLLLRLLQATRQAATTGTVRFRLP